MIEAMSVMALMPSIAAWGKLQIDNSLGAVAGVHSITPDMIASMAQTGVAYHGLSILGGGSILAGVVLGSITTYILERQFLHAAAFALTGAVMTIFGLMHGEAIGIGQTPIVAASYLMVSGVLAGCARFAMASAPSVEAEEEVSGALGELAVD